MTEAMPETGSSTRSGLLLVAMLTLSSAAAGEIRPLAVSPGEEASFSVLATRCPTFSWSAVAGATAYELVVIEAGEPQGGPGAALLADPAAGSPVLWTPIPGAALSWTPATDRCLDRGTSYAWLVGAKKEGGEVDWSEPRWFRIREKPSLEEVEEAIATLESYLEAEGRLPGQSKTREPSSVGPAIVEPGASGSLLGTASTQPGTRAIPPGFEVGISSQPVSNGMGTIGVHGATDSTIDQSIGVFGEAVAPSGVADGVRGVSGSTSGTGVRGSANAHSGVTAGVWGSASSPTGYGGFFFNLGLGGSAPGLFASGALNASPDLILGANLLYPEADVDDGRIHSAPAFPSSDLVFQSNDDISLKLNADADGDFSNFTIVDNADTTLFNVNPDGTVFVLGDLGILGQPIGNLLDNDDVQAAIDAHLSAEHPKLVFVTSQTYNGNLGGTAGADQKCADRAAAAGLLGQFKAWISGDGGGEAAGARLGQATVPYRRLDGVKVADDWDDLTDGTNLDAAINVDENGNTVGGTVYTNTDPDGTMHAIDRECGPSTGPGADWNSSSNLQSGSYGTITATAPNWSHTSNDDCMNERRLYCFQQ